MLKTRIALLVAPVLLVGTLGAALGQDRDDQRSRRDNRGDSTFYNGVRDGGSNGYYGGENHPNYDQRYRTRDNGYYNNGYTNNQYYNHGDRRYRDDHQGGIGPGKGALIGGAGGAVLGALFGHGLGSTLIGGAAGAGVGAIVGGVHQDHQRDQYDERH